MKQNSFAIILVSFLSLFYYLLLFQYIQCFHIKKNIQQSADFDFYRNETTRDSLIHISLNSLSPSLGENIKVYWSVSPDSVTSNSYITLNYYGIENSEGNFVSRSRNLNGIKKGDTTLKGPKEAGLYEIRYVKDENRMTLATQGSFLVNPNGNNISFTVSNLRTHPEESVSLKWKVKKNNISTNCYICLNIVGMYEKCLMEIPISDLEGGATVQMPTFAGYFIFRLLTKENNTTSTCLYASQLIQSTDPLLHISLPSRRTVIAGSIVFNWDVGNVNTTDWIGLYSINNANALTKFSQPLQLITLNGAKSGTAHFILPPNSQAGHFMLVYFQNHRPIAVSDLINAVQPVVQCLPNKKTMSKIKHLVIICTENHSFDSYYGNYCKAKAFSEPKCTNGPDCCEKPPEMIDGYHPRKLTDATNQDYDPPHTKPNLECEMNSGKMDKFIQGCPRSDSKNFAVAPKEYVEVIHQYSNNYATADHFFQAAACSSCANNMYLARASFVFSDNAYMPAKRIGQNCYLKTLPAKDVTRLYYDPSITDILAKCGFQLKSYAEGYTEASKKMTKWSCYPQGYDSSDIPFIYYASAIDHPHFIGDYADFFNDIQKGTLADVSFVKPLGENSGHPIYGTITDEQEFTKETVDYILKSKYADDTLILWFPDESGGYYDHIPPPPTSKIDNMPYGPRIPVIAIGKFAKKNYISHVEMEHSSIVKFIEWNWLAGQTGHLNTRDRTVNNIGDLLDPKETEIEIPSY